MYSPSVTRESPPPPPVESQVDDGPASAADGPPQRREHDQRGEHGRIVLRAFLSEYARGRRMAWPRSAWWSLRARPRYYRSNLQQCVEQVHRHAAKLETAIEEKRWPAAIQHVNDLMREERHMAYSLLAWIIKLLET